MSNKRDGEIPPPGVVAPPLSPLMPPKTGSDAAARANSNGGPVVTSPPGETADFLSSDTAASRPSTAIYVLILALIGGVIPAFLSANALVWLSGLTGTALLYLWVRYARHMGPHPVAAALPSTGLRFATLVFSIIVTTAAVLHTGGSDSPLAGILFLPIMLSSLFFGLMGSAPTGVLIAILFLLGPGEAGTIAAAQGVSSGRFTDVHGHALIQSVIYVLVAAMSGAMAQSLLQAASEARARAAAQEERARAEAERAAETEWLTDTAVMMDSLFDREHMLSIALLRLSELAPCDTAAVFLRDFEGSSLDLALVMGIPAETVALRSLPHGEQEPVWGHSFGARLWTDIEEDSSDLGSLSGLDPKARSVLVAPLRTIDDFFGLLFVASHSPGGFSERDRLRVHQFSQHIVFPLQRVRLRALATTDVMTGLNNQRAFRSRLRDEMERARRYGSPVSLVLLDIDHFKHANDTHGHRAGDALLAQIGAILRRSARSTDFTARYGGEEMAVICPETRMDDAASLAERIRKAVEENVFTLPEDSGGGEARLTVSLGVAAAPEHAASEAALIEAADKALFAAKSSGRNLMRCYPDVCDSS